MMPFLLYQTTFTEAYIYNLNINDINLQTEQKIWLSNYDDATLEKSLFRKQ